MGYLGALIAILGFGVYMVPLKWLPKLSSWTFLVLAGFGIFLSGSVSAAVFNAFSLNWIGIGSGFLWTFGAASCFSAVQNEAGLSGSGTRAIGMGILVSFLCAVFILQEKTLFYFSIPAILFILFGLYILDPEVLKNPRRNFRSLGAGVVFGIYLLPYQLVELALQEFVFSFSLGVFLSTALLFLVLFQIGKKEVRQSLINTLSFKTVFICIFAGIIWSIGNQGCLLAVESLGYTIGYPLTQLNLLVNILCGVIFFGEFPTIQMRFRLLFSALLIIAGSFLLAFSKAV